MSIMINLIELLSCCDSQFRQESEAFEGLCSHDGVKRND